MMKMKKLLIVVIVLTALLSIGLVGPTSGCEPPPPPPPTLCVSDLIAGRNWDSPAGNLLVSDDGEYLTVTFEMSGGWSLDESHLYVGIDPPEKSAPGRFPYSGHADYVIPLSDFGVVCGDSLFIAAHGVVTLGGQSETAWADTYGIPFGKSWAMYIEYIPCYGCIGP